MKIAHPIHSGGLMDVNPLRQSLSGVQQEFEILQKLGLGEVSLPERGFQGWLT